MEEQTNGTTNAPEADEQSALRGESVSPQQAVPAIPPAVRDVPVANLPTEDPGAHAAIGAANTDPTEKTFAQRVRQAEMMIVLTCIIAGATIANVIVFYLESESTSRRINQLAINAGGIVASMNTALSDSKEAIAKAFAENKEALEVSAKQSKAALDASIEASRTDQRAWVGIGQLSAHPETFHVGDSSFVNISFKNTGKTPAKNITMTIVINPTSRGKPPRFSYVGDKVARYGLLSPNGDIFVTLQIARSMSTGEPSPLTPEIFSVLASGEVIEYIHGQLVYQDIFERYHWATFCYFLLNIGNVVSFGACAEHNDAGDGQEPKYQAATPPMEWPPR